MFPRNENRNDRKAFQPEFGAYEIALEPSKLQKEGENPEKGNPGMQQTLVQMRSETRVHLDVPPERKPEREYVRMFPRNEGTFAKTTLLRNRPCLPVN